MKSENGIGELGHVPTRTVLLIVLGMLLILLGGVANSAILQATTATTPSSVNLTSVGTGDWVHYGLTSASSVNRKAAVTQQISALTTTAAASQFVSGGARPQMVWTDGTPTASASSRTGLYLPGVGNSYSFTLPADTTTRTAIIYVGAWQAQGTLTMSLSDSSATPVTVVVDNAAGVIDRQVTVTYAAASAGKTLQVQYVLTNQYTGGNITLQSVAVAGAAPNNPPVLAPIGNRSVTASQLLSFGVSATDGDGPGPLVLTATGLPSGASFTDNGGGSGTFSWTPTPGQVSGVPYNVTFASTENGGSGQTDTEIVQITVTAAAGGGALSAAAVATASSVNLTSVGTGDWVHYGLTSASSVNRKAGVTQQISALTTTAAASQFVSGGARPQMVWTDGTPTASASSRTGLYLPGVGNSYSFTLPADTTTRTAIIYVGAWQAQGTLTMSLSDSSATPVTVVVDNAAGVIDRQVTVTYAAASAGKTLQVQYVLTNQYTGGNITLQSVAVAGAAPNNPPVLAPIGNRSVTASQLLSFGVSATDGDGPGPLVLTATGLPSGASFTDNGGGSGTFSWTPTPGQVSGVPYNVTFASTENGGSGQTDTEIVQITVTAVPNNPPVLAPIGNRSVTASQLLSFGVSATDGDGPGPLVLTATGLPSGASFTDNGGGSGTFSWTPTPGQVSGVPYNVTFASTENGGSGQTDTEIVQITVTAAAGGGALSAAAVATASSVNLTSVGTGDWVHYGLTSASSVNRKAGVTQQISALTTTAAASQFVSGGARPQMVWTDGTPTASASSRTGLYLPGVGNSYSFTLPADTTTRTAIIYVGAWQAQGTLTMSLSDSSATPVTVVVDNAAGVIDRQVTVTYAAASAGKTLQVQYVLTNQYTGGNITLQSVALTQVLSLPFTDDFNDGNSNGWVFVDEVPNASSWQVVSSKLRQLNRVESVFAFEESYHLGTLGYLATGTSLTDYQFGLTATYLGAGLKDDVGVLFRYRDPLNYYRLTLNGRYGFSRLEKQVNGVFTPLATNARGYTPAQVLNVSVRVSGSNIVTVVNAEEVFSVTDTAFSSGSVALFTQDLAEFDDVSITALSSAPDVTLSSPLSHVTRAGTQLAAAASARNVPVGGSVEFLLDGVTSITDLSEPFSAVFSSVAAGNHTVAAILRNSSNVELDRDTNTTIGTSGSYLVAIGDSNTNGIGDSVATDNVSNLQKVIATEGYESRLTDQLDSSSAAATNLVFNEGIGGDDSFATLNSRVDSIRARHSSMDTTLVLLGTNDALAGIPSGLGCSGAACNGTFKGNMQAIIDKLGFNNYPTNTISSGIQVMVGEVLPVYTSATPFNSTTNNLIRDYNTMIRTELSGVSIGPDLFGFFMSSAAINYRSLFADTLHLNALGHNIMATLWHNKLKSPIAVPFVLDELSSTATALPTQNLMEAGDVYTLDQSYTLTAFPGALTDGRWLMLNNADFANISSNYVSFKVDRASTVYVALDGGSTNLPGWMSGFSLSGTTISSSNPQAPTYTLYQRSFAAASTVTLGGASAAPATGVDANYVVTVVEN